MKNLGLATITLSALLLSGCGGGGGKSDPIKKKNYIAIWTEVPAGVCESQEFRNLVIQAGASNDVILKETANNTSCATYGKQNDGNQCAIEYIGGGDRNCVAAFNAYTGSNKQLKLMEEVQLSDMLNIVASGL